MKYDFTSLIDRHGMDSLAVDPGPESGYRKDIKLIDGIEDHIPMWVADMNFPTCPTIPEAIVKRAMHPAYGYFFPRPEYFDAIKFWHKEKKGVDDIQNENIGYENGVLGGVACALKVAVRPGTKVLVHSPVYVGFTGVLKNGGYEVVHSPLKIEDGIWRMDYEDMEEKLKTENISVVIFCSPHNPSGRVWERWEIEKAMELFRKYDIRVISDEIWSDLILEGHKHIPTQSVSEDAKMRTAAFYAPSKTFNLAGLIGSYHVIYDLDFKQAMKELSAKTHYNSMNVLSMHALIAAYSTEGSEWVKELDEVLTSNINYGYNFILERFKGVSLCKPQGTYMLYLDCSGWLKSHHMTTEELLKKGYEAGVDWQNGEPFMVPNTIRMNLALPLSRVKEAFDRLDKYVFNC